MSTFYNPASNAHDEVPDFYFDFDFEDDFDFPPPPATLATTQHVQQAKAPAAGSLHHDHAQLQSATLSQTVPQTAKVMINDSCSAKASPETSYSAPASIAAHVSLLFSALSFIMLWIVVYKMYVIHSKADTGLVSMHSKIEAGMKAVPTVGSIANAVEVSDSA